LIWFGFVKFTKFVVSQVVMLDVHSGGLSEEGKWGGWARWVAVRDGSRGAEEPGKTGVALTASLNGMSEVRKPKC